MAENYISKTRVENEDYLIKDAEARTSIGNINDNLTASDNLTFKFASDEEGNHGYLDASDNFVPFSGGAGDFLISDLTFGDYSFSGAVTDGSGSRSGWGSYGGGTVKFHCEDYKYLHIGTLMLTRASGRDVAYSTASVTLKNENGTVLKKADGTNASWSGSVNRTFSEINNISLENCNELFIDCSFFAQADSESAIVSIKNMTFSSSNRQ